jgi:hypothetical protein
MVLVVQLTRELTCGSQIESAGEARATPHIARQGSAQPGALVVSRQIGVNGEQCLRFSRGKS